MNQDKIQNLHSILINILESTCIAKWALEQYEAIGNMAPAINKSRHDFVFGFLQKVMLDFAILQILVIYDKSNKEKKKYSIFDILEDLKNIEYSPYTAEVLSIQERVDTIINYTDFKRLKHYRNKYIAHHEQYIAHEKIKTIPSINKIHGFIMEAEKLCIGISKLISADYTIDITKKNMKESMKNIISQLIDLNLEKN